MDFLWSCCSPFFCFVCVTGRILWPDAPLHFLHSAAITVERSNQNQLWCANIREVPILKVHCGSCSIAARREVQSKPAALREASVFCIALFLFSSVFWGDCTGAERRDHKKASFLLEWTPLWRQVLRGDVCCGKQNSSSSITGDHS